jgi:hypothetical protein
MKCLTIKRGPDGFGSQLFSIISGILYSNYKNYKYYHTKIENIKLVDKVSYQNDEIILANKLIDNFINNMGYESLLDKQCDTLPFTHDLIFDEGSELFFTESIMDKLKNSYFFDSKTNFDNEKINVAVHIRRGNDVLESDKTFRWIESSVYDDLIYKINSKIENVHFYVYSWNEPNLSINIPNLTYKTVESGNRFIDDFHELVNSNILVVGSSTFSISAGFFNKGMVICDNTLCKLHKTPIPQKWKENFNKLLNT